MTREDSEPDQETARALLGSHALGASRLAVGEASVDLPLGLPTDDAPDPDLDDLPEPRRPAKTLTIVAMAVTIVAALFVSWKLLPQVSYAFVKGAPSDLGDLTNFDPSRARPNSWAHGEALLGTTGAVRYGRPLERDTFRLAPVAGTSSLWVEIRVPQGLEGPRFVPPTSFVGRLVPFADSGLSHASLPDAVAGVGAGRVEGGAWLLVDGETPATSRWTVAVCALLLGFAAWSAWGLSRILRPAR